MATINRPTAPKQGNVTLPLPIGDSLTEMAAKAGDTLSPAQAAEPTMAARVAADQAKYAAGLQSGQNQLIFKRT